MDPQANEGCFDDLLGAEGVVRDAEAARILFARVKGYPAWPVSGFRRFMSVSLCLVRVAGTVRGSQTAGASRSNKGLCLGTRFLNVERLVTTLVVLMFT
jgi:hypothetical protein